MATARKTKLVSFRVTEIDDLLVRQAADLSDETITDFYVEGAKERAQRLMADRAHFVLDDKSWSEFLRALDSPAEVRPELVDLFSRARPE